MKKLLTAVAILAATTLLTACGADNDSDTINVRIGLVGAFGSQWHVVQEILDEQGYNINIEQVHFTDFITPNLALNDGDLDLNAFQTLNFFNHEREVNNYELDYIGWTTISPLSLFPNTNRVASLDDFGAGSVIGVPHDPTNESRALRFLDSIGLITVDPTNDGIVSVLDIVDNPRGIEIRLLESGMLSSILPDIDGAVINAGNAVAGGLSPANDSLIREDISHPSMQQFNNLIAARTVDINAGGERLDAFMAIVRAFNTDRVAEHILSTYDGAFLPIW